ncbi:hypothetical protein HUG17_2582 [Dermatophagoides farinae]|uniref:DDE Tnp4 domain-containing protein n=1 Tax=Dermatophagoides farinae TaxID=6954 RepID=A0A9D4NTU4_DERFA|nr:hypothetical protein HUG17_2582 [Dermatophagoides farinae]
MSESSLSSRQRDETRCPICSFRLRNCSNVGRKLIKSQEEVHKVLRSLNKRVEIGDTLCSKCGKRIYNKTSPEKKQLLPDPEPCSSSMLMDNSEHFTSTLSIDDSISTIIDDQSQSIMVDPTLEYTQIEKDVIEMPFSRPIISHSRCFICPSTSNLKNIPIEARLQPGDYFVLDNGFRDVVSILKKRGFNVLIPNLEEKNIEPTNDSKLITKIRWVVKAVHAEIGQKYKLLHNQFENKSLPKIAAYCRIAFFLHNEFGQKFNFDSENQLSHSYLNEIES